MMSGKNPHTNASELQKQWDLLDEKIVRLRTARIIETDTAILFKLDKQIEEAETEREKVAQQIDELEQQVETHQEQHVSPIPFSRKYSCLLKIGGVTVISIALITVVRSYKDLKLSSTSTPLPSYTTSPVPSSSSEMTFASWCLKKDLLTMDEKHTVDELLLKVNAKKNNLNCQKSQEALAQIPDHELDLTSKQIVDIKPLSSLNNLNSLNLRDNHIKDISALVDLTKLTYLNLSDNKIEDITPLKPLRKLKYLDLENNQIQEVTSLASLRELETLKLTNNNIYDVTALSSLKNLKEPLELLGNDIPITKQTCPVKMGCNF